jgi:hypothetical protein
MELPRLPVFALVDGDKCPVVMVARAGVEPATFRFSGGRSYQLSYLARTYALRALP